MQRRRRDPKAGFTLVEMAIILVVIGILTGLGAGMMGPMIKRIKTNETRDTLAAAAEGVVSHAALHKEIPTSAEIPSVARTMEDSWKKDLMYVPDHLLTVPDICGRRSTGLSVVQCGTDPACAGPRIVQNAAFVLASGGENMNIQVGTGAFAGCPAGKTCVRVWDTGTPNLDGHPSDMSRNESFDDLVAWITLDELRIKAGCQGPALRIVNQDLPSGSEKNTYTAEVSADGGVPFGSGGRYLWCVQGAVPAGLALTPNATSADCSAAAEGTPAWGQADNLIISGTPSAGSNGSYALSVFARDDNDPVGANDNMASRHFAITVEGGLFIVNNELPFGSEGSSFNATLYAESGTRFTSGGGYKWCREGMLPIGLAASPANTSTDCAGAAEGTPAWGQADSLIISGTPAAGTANTYPVKIFVRDGRNPGNDPECGNPANGDECAGKSFVITINPSSSTQQICPQGIRVWNAAGTRADFLINGTCRNNIGNNSEITTAAVRLNSGGSIRRFSGMGTCSQSPGITLTHSQAASADGDRDCQVRFTATGVADR